MLFEDLISLYDIPLLPLFTVFILKVAIVEFRLAIEDQCFVEAAHHLGVNFGGIFQRYLLFL